jgi:hypothetical protein
VVFVETSLSNYIHFVPPKGEFVRFENDEAYVAKGVEWKLFTERSVKKELLYKANGQQVKVKLIGYEEYGNGMQTIVVQFEDGNLSCIHPAYLKEMQSSSFGKDSLTGEHAVVDEEGSNIGKTTESRQETTVNKEKAKSKKEPAKPKLALPEDKVHFTAKVKEFTSKMNHFTGEEDEVILLQQVKVEGEHELEVGDAWCSYSKTLKKAELAEEDVLSFDGKIVEKKFNKEILYKINNPSKVKKA